MNGLNKNVAKSDVTVDSYSKKNLRTRVRKVIWSQCCKWEEELVRGMWKRSNQKCILYLFNYQSQTTSSLRMNSGDYFQLS